MEKLKQLFHRHPRPSTEQIIDRIKGYDTVSFDVFDTLLKRDVQTEADVFDYVEKSYIQRYKENIFGFRALRLRAQNDAIREITGREIQLSDIYKRVAESVGTEPARKLMEIELELEEGLSCANPVMAGVYQYCVKAGKRIICISDMYLDGAFINRLLKRSGFTQINAVYVSSDAGKRKRDGSLFTYVLAKEGLRPRELIHIGDSKRGDFLAAARIGIHTVCIAKIYRHTRYWRPDKDFVACTLQAFLNNRLPKIESRQVAIGYEVYGPLLYVFTKWLCGHLDIGKPILFFARDCYIVKRAFTALAQPEREPFYFLASRKSLMRPLLYQDTSLNLLRILIRSEAAVISLEDILKKVGLQPQNYKKAAAENGLSLDTRIRRDHLTGDARFAKFWEMVEQDIREDSEHDHLGFEAFYAKWRGENEIQVVDIGWRCTMQYCLKRLLGEDCTIKGYYMGVRENAFIGKNDYEAFYLQGENDEQKKVLIAEMTALLEIFFTAPHGSVKGYAVDGSVLYEPYECEHDRASRELVEQLHRGAMCFIQDMRRSPLEDLIQPESELLFRGLKPLSVRPKKEEIAMFERFPFRTGTGIAQMAMPKSFIFYLLHPGQLSYDFANSCWKVVFMKKLLKLPLPYERMFRFLYRHRRK